jgi:hypothetical protein
MNHFVRILSQITTIIIVSCGGSSTRAETDETYYVANTRPPDAFLALRTKPSSAIGERIGWAFWEMRRGSAVPSHSRGRRWADSQSLKPHDCAKMRAAHADYRRRHAGSHRPGVSAMIAERQRPRGGQAAHAPVRKPTAAPRRVTTSDASSSGGCGYLSRPRSRGVMRRYPARLT